MYTEELTKLLQIKRLEPREQKDGAIAYFSRRQDAWRFLDLVAAHHGTAGMPFKNGDDWAIVFSTSPVP